jgi:hypothetical protein
VTANQFRLPIVVFLLAGGPWRRRDLACPFRTIP